MAKINILSSKKQWNSIRDNDFQSATQPINDQISTKVPRFFKPGSSYNFEVEFELSKSTRNLNLGKFMVYLKLLDSSGMIVANSSRPVIIPYESSLSLYMDVIKRSPFVFFGLANLNQPYQLRIPMINDYMEPQNDLPATEMVELSLSTNVVDISKVTVTAMPTLRGFV